MKNCPKCKGKMEKGTYGGLWGGLVPWAKGSFYFKWISDKGTEGKVVAYKCIKCGYLENYTK